MHVLILPSEQFIPPDEPGAGIFQYHQATALVDKGVKVGVLSIKQTFSIPMIVKGMLYKVVGKASNNECDKYGLSGLASTLRNKMFRISDYITEREVDNISVVDVDGFYYYPPSDKTDVYGWTQAGIAAYSYYIDKYGMPDIIHAHSSLYGGILASVLNKKHNIPYIITEHSSRWARAEVSDSSLQNKAKIAYSYSSGNYAVSSDFAGKLNDIFKGLQFNVLHNVIDPYLQRNVKPAELRQEDDFVYLHIAEFKPVKDQLTLLSAFKEVVVNNNKVQLRIAGSGDLEKQLKEKVEKLGITDHVKFLGYLDRTQVLQELANCNCLVMCSLYETFGVVLIEAMLSGKPVIASSVGGALDIVSVETGKLVAPKDVKGLTEAMLNINSEYSKYDSENIHNYVVDKFGGDTFTKQLIDIYEEVVKNDK